MSSRGLHDPLRAFGFLLRDASLLYARTFERHAQELGLSLVQCRVLANVQRHEGLSQARLASLTDLDPMTLGRQVARLESDGLLAREPDPEDGRAHRLHLTDTAQPLLDTMWRLADRTRAAALAGFDASERALLSGLLQRLLANLEAEPLSGSLPRS